MTQGSDHALEILSKLKSLRSFNGEKGEFWQAFLNQVVHFARAKAVFLLRFREGSDGLDFQGFAPQNMNFEFLKDDQLKLAVLATVHRAKSNSFAYEPLGNHLGSMGKSILFVLRLEYFEEGEQHYLGLILDSGKRSQMNELALRLQLISDIPRQVLSGHGISQEVFLADKTLKVCSMVLKKNRFLLASMTLCNELASRFSCSRVSMGWHEGRYVKVQAISHLDRFNRTTDACNELELVFEECFDQNQEILLPSLTEDPVTITHAHEHYRAKNGVDILLSLPLRRDSEPFAVITLERMGRAFEASELYSIRLILNQLTETLDGLYERDQFFLKRWVHSLKRGMDWFFGVEKSLWKLGIVLGSFALFFFLAGKWDYSVEVSAQLATDSTALIAVPYDGMVYEVHATAGDLVKKDQELLKLDTQELYLRLSEARAEESRYMREAQKARAQNELADMKIAQAKQEQATAKVKRIDYFLAHSNLKSPFEGVIIEGEKSELLGAPMERGQVAFKIARLEGIYLKLSVPERDVDIVEEFRSGKFVPVAKPNEEFSFEIETVIPVANVDGENGNVFFARAKLVNEPETWFRPGMSGIGSIHAGEKPVWWILFHRALDWARLYLWL